MKNLLQNAAVIIGSSLVLAAILLTNVSMIAFTASTNTVSASVSIPNNCIAAITNTVIGFGTTVPGTNQPTQNGILLTNDGNIKANVLLSGTVWTWGSNTFNADNTIWDFSTNAGGVKGNALSTSPADTFNQIAISQTIPLYFGVNVPSGQGGGTYTQTITVEDGC